MTDYSSVRAKLGRAGDHLKALESELEDWMRSRPLALIPTTSADGLSERWHVKITNPLPTAINTISGDCIHNFRSVLDHLAMALALDNGADPYNRGVSFPVCEDAERFFGKPKNGVRPAMPPSGTGGYALRALSASAQDFIEVLQPYNRGPGAIVLTEIQYLDNQDKHRFFIEPRLEQLARWGPINPGVHFDYEDPLHLDDGALFATVSYPLGYSGKQDPPPVSAGICVQRSSRLGFVELQRFLRMEVLPFITGVVDKSMQRFP